MSRPCGRQGIGGGELRRGRCALPTPLLGAFGLALAAVLATAGARAEPTSRPSALSAASGRPDETGPVELPPPAPRLELHRGNHVQLVVLHLPGISGFRAIDRTLLEGLLDAWGRDRVVVRVYDWPAYDYGMGALLNVRRNRLEALHAATWIAEALKEFPDARVVLTSHSGGTGIAAWALDALPAGAGVDAWLLLAPALSPEFDLSAALERVRGRAWVLVSEHDPVLPMTRVFGTIDRKAVPSAGLAGFVPPARHVERAYAKLTTMRYDPAWARWGHLGDHVGMMERAFARELLGPLVGRALERTPDAPATSR